MPCTCNIKRSRCFRFLNSRNVVLVIAFNIIGLHYFIYSSLQQPIKIQKYFFLDWFPGNIEVSQTDYAGQTTLNTSTKSSTGVDLLLWTKSQASLKPANTFIVFSTEEKNISQGITAKQEEESERKKGKKKRQIVFLKVHKAASSTVQNVILRFAIAHNLSILLSQNPGWAFRELGHQINPRFIVGHTRGSQYDVFCNHIIFNREVMASYFPTSTVYVGILREPFEQFRSAFVYYSRYITTIKELTRVISAHPDDPIHSFLQNPTLYAVDDPRLSYVNNRMGIDLGFPPQNFETTKRNATLIKDFVKYIDSVVDLVLIAELFDESMVLLRRFMNWSTKDVMYLKNNVFSNLRPSEKKSNDWFHKKIYSQEDIKLFEKWAPVDTALYRHFLAVFINKTKQEVNFQQEVDAYRKVREEVARFCQSVPEETNVTESLLIRKRMWVDEFLVTSSDCKFMLMKEKDFVNYARLYQSERRKGFV